MPKESNRIQQTQPQQTQPQQTQQETQPQQFEKRYRHARVMRRKVPSLLYTTCATSNTGTFSVKDEFFCKRFCYNFCLKCNINLLFISEREEG